MDISLGIITYKDRKIDGLLESIKKQKLQKVRVKEIIVVCIEADKRHIRNLLRKYGFEKAKILTDKKRKGKYNAVNLFFKEAKSGILVMSSGDILLHEAAVESICRPFSDSRTGIVAARPLPMNINSENMLGFTVELLWELHHIISYQQPKFGEFIAFRNLGFILPKTAVDEETIASIIYSRGYKGRYAENAVIYNKGPGTVHDYIKQRRRVYCGHMQLRKISGYKVPTLDSVRIISHLLKRKELLKHPLKALYAISLESAARALGFFDYIAGKDYAVWKIIKK